MSVYPENRMPESFCLVENMRRICASSGEFLDLFILLLYSLVCTLSLVSIFYAVLSPFKLLSLCMIDETQDRDLSVGVVIPGVRFHCQMLLGV